MDDSERAKLVEIVKTGMVEGEEAVWDRKDIADIVMSIRRTGVMLRLERGDDDPYGLAFKEIANAAMNIRMDRGFEPVSPHYSLSIDRLVELYSEAKSTPERVNKNREYVRVLAKLIYGQY